MVRCWRRQLSTSCMIVLAAASAGAAAEYETPKNRLAKDVLPAAVAAGADYTVGDPVVSDGYNAERLSQELKATYRAPGFTGGFELWVTGTLSPRGKQELQARGFTVVEQVGGRIDIVD